MSARAGAGGRGAGLERALALALLLPILALVLLLPRALLAGDPEAALTGAGWTALLSLPLALLLAFGRAAPAARAGLALLGGVLAAGALSLWIEPPLDTLEADRAVALALASAVAFQGGATLGAEGRRWLARGLVLASLAASLGALLGGAPYAGPLQNTGATSELALPGALAGAWLFAVEPSRAKVWRTLGAVALAAEACYATRAPVLAAVVALTAVLALGVVLLEGGARRRLAALAGLALAAGAVGFAGRDAPPSPGTVEVAAEPAPAPGDFAGFEVRWRVWRSLPRLVADHPGLGVGPGQFAAAYPPYRDPAEQRLSEAGMAGASSEVELAHNDWLQATADVGLIGGALWIAFLGLALVRALAVLRAGRAEAALAAGALGVLVNALMRSPLLANPAAAPAGFALFGALLARPEQGRRFSRAGVLVVVGLLAWHTREARSIVAHGRALTALVQHGNAEALIAALAARPDSVPALSAAARAAEGSSDARAVAAAWEAVLARRPHHREALAQVGKSRAEAGDLDGARLAWKEALELAPADPALHNNLMRASAFAGDVEEALAWHERAGFEPDRLAELACALLREQADLERARALFDRAEPRYRELSAQKAFDLAGELEAEGAADRARVLKGFAHLAWARQHAIEGDPASAVRSYRQAAAGLSAETPAGSRVPPRLRYELAAALALTGQEDEARSELPPGPHPASVLRELPPWAGEALLPLFSTAPGVEGE